MKFRNMFLKYYAHADDGTQGGGGDGGASAYEAMQSSQTEEGSESQEGQEHDHDDGKQNEGDPDDEGKRKEGQEGTEGEGEDEEEEFLFDGKAITTTPTDEDDQDGDTDLVKHLRAQLREQRKQFKESTQKQTDPQNIPADMPRKPEMGDDGIDWDPEKYAEALDKWTEDKAAFLEHQAKQQQRLEEFGKKFSEGQQRYQTERAKALKKYAGFEKAETVIAELPEPLQAGLMIHSKNPTALVMAIGRNADLRKQVETAYNTDHIALGYLIRDIESRAGSAPKAKQKLNQAPEVKGQNGVANVGQLEALRKRAEETGDYTDYLAAKNRKTGN